VIREMNDAGYRVDAAHIRQSPQLWLKTSVKAFRGTTLQLAFCHANPTKFCN
jgi:hypothetical protein